MYIQLMIDRSQNHNKFKRRDNNDMGTITKDYHCEVCECSFRTEFDLNGHISQHRQVM